MAVTLIKPTVLLVFLHGAAVSWVRKYLKQHPAKLVMSMDEQNR